MVSPNHQPLINTNLTFYIYIYIYFNFPRMPTGVLSPIQPHYHVWCLAWKSPLPTSLQVREQLISHNLKNLNPLQTCAVLLRSIRANIHRLIYPLLSLKVAVIWLWLLAPWQPLYSLNLISCYVKHNLPERSCPAWQHISFCFLILKSFVLQHLTQVLLVNDTQMCSLFPHLIDAIHHVYNSTPV